MSTPTPCTGRLRCFHSRLDPLHSAIADPNELRHAIDAGRRGALALPSPLRRDHSTGDRLP
jgi:hypothetical protein